MALKGERGFLIAMALALSAYIALCLFSYGDIIYSTELSSYMSRSLIETGQIQSPPARQAFMTLIAGVLLLTYTWGYVSLRNAPVRPPILVSLATAFGLISLLTMPFDSTDITVYINQGWLQSYYHLNPYHVAVAQISGWWSDPMLKQHWTHYLCPYGPLFAGLCKILVSLGSADYVRTVMLFKGLNTLAHAGIAAMVLAAVRNLKTEEAAWQSFYLYAFSPMILMHCLDNAHNDLLLAFFTMLAVYVLLRGQYQYVIPALAAGAAMKFASLLLVPGFLLFLWRFADKKIVWLSALATLIVFGALSFYYWGPPSLSNLQPLWSNLQLMHGSLTSLIAQIWPASEKIFKLAALGVFGLLFAMRAKDWFGTAERERLQPKILHDSVLLLAVFICAVAPKFMPWYLAMFFPLALCLPESARLRAFSIAACALMTFSILWFGALQSFEPPMFLIIALSASEVYRALIGKNGETSQLSTN